MSDQPPPPDATPPDAMPPVYAPPPEPGAAPPKQGLSTGAKVAIGCGAALLLLLILMFACFGVLGKVASDRIEDIETSMEDQEQAGRTAEELEREHPFTPPADGALDEGHVERFFAVTDDVWGEIGEWAEDMQDRSDRIQESGGDAGFRDGLAAMQGMGRARVVLVEALEEHDMAPSAYVWTGFMLMRAHEAAASGSAGGIPEANLELARRHADRLEEMRQNEGEEFDRGSVLALAYTYFPRMDVLMPQGFDTTAAQP